MRHTASAPRERRDGTAPFVVASESSHISEPARGLQRPTLGWVQDGVASRAGTLMSWVRRVARVSRAWKADARQPARG